MAKFKVGDYVKVIKVITSEDKQFLNKVIRISEIITVIGVIYMAHGLLFLENQLKLSKKPIYQYGIVKFCKDNYDK
jgi:hypothetical protein